MIVIIPSKQDDSAKLLCTCCENPGSSAPWNPVDDNFAVFHAKEIEITIQIWSLQKIMPHLGVC